MQKEDNALCIPKQLKNLVSKIYSIVIYSILKDAIFDRPIYCKMAKLCDLDYTGKQHVYTFTYALDRVKTVKIQLKTYNSAHQCPFGCQSPCIAACQEASSMIQQCLVVQSFIIIWPILQMKANL